MEKEKKAIYKKWWFWVIVILIIGAIGASTSSNDNSVTISNSDSSQQNVSESKENKKVDVGQVIQTEEVKIIYRSCTEYNGYDSYSKPSEGNKVVRAEFEFENISNGDIYLENMDCYADGEKCESYYYADDYKSPTLEELSKGKKVTAVLYYEVPKSATETIIEYETNYWTDEKIEFIIK